MESYLKLRRRQQVFVDLYVELGSGVGAARRMKPDAKNPRKMAWTLLNAPGVRDAIEERKAEAIAEAGISHVRTLQEVARIAYFDKRRMRDVDGNVLPVHQWPDDVAAAVGSTEVETLFEGRGEDRKQIGLLTKYRAWPKVEALKLLMQYQKLLVERHEHSGPGGKPLQPPSIAITFEDGGPGSAADEGVEVSGNDAAPKPQPN